jgi:hypothetical protein
MTRLAWATTSFLSLFSRLDGLSARGRFPFGAKIDALQALSHSADLDSVMSVLDRQFVCFRCEAHWHVVPPNRNHKAAGMATSCKC